MEVSYKHIAKGRYYGNHSETENDYWGECDWVIERSFAWTTRFRRLVRDYERLPPTQAGLHLVVFACLMLHRWMAFSGP